MPRERWIAELFATGQTLQRAWKSHFHRTMGEEGLSPGQMALLFHIRANQPVSGKQIGAELQMSKSAVTQLIDGLDGQGLVVRQHDPQDRRVSYVSLSVAGKQKVDALEDKRREFFVRATESLTDEEIDSMMRIQQKMLQQMEKQQAEGRERQ